MIDSITKRLDQITRIPKNYLMDAPPPPKSVKIELSGRCNYRCHFCSLPSREAQPKRDMDFALFQRICQEMHTLGVEEFGLFFIGESFMNPTLLLEAIRFLKGELRVPYTFLTTNGSLASPEHVEACMAAGLDSLKWSVNACDEHAFEQMIGVKPSLFHRSLDHLRGARRLRDAGGYATRLYASSIRYDGLQHEKMKALLEERVLPYVDEHYWLPLYSMGGLSTERMGRHGYRPSPGNPGRYDAPVEPLPCWTVFTAAHVLSDGRLTACCFDGVGDWVMGDLRYQRFMEAWHSEDFLALRRAHLMKNVDGTVCESCVFGPKGQTSSTEADVPALLSIHREPVRPVGVI